MKKICLTLASVAFIISNGYANTVNIDGVKWAYTITGEKATITGMYFAKGRIIVPSSVDGFQVVAISENVGSGSHDVLSLCIPDSVMTIGRGAFSNCDLLGDVTIGSGVTSINGDDNSRFEGEIPNYGAFSFCSSLTNVTLGAKLTTIGGYSFYGCGSLRKVVVPDSVATIGRQAFQLCTKMTEVSVGNGLKSVGYAAFANCTGLRMVAFGNGGVNNLTLGEDAFTGCTWLERVELPDYLSNIGINAFSSCYSLKSLRIPDSVQIIGRGAFSNCDLLGDVTIGSGVTSINGDDNSRFEGEIPNYGAFSFCSSLTNVTLGAKLTTIGGYSFYGCGSLRKVVVPDSVATIGRQAFQLCTKMTEVSVGNGLKSVGYAAFANCTGLRMVAFGNGGVNNLTLGEDAFTGCTWLERVELPDYLSNIGINAFSSCYSLKSFRIPDSVQIIGRGAFSNCDLLGDVTIGSGVTSINGDDNSRFEGEIPNYGAFSFCSSLTNVTLGANLTTIGGYSFYGCESLRKVVVPDSVATIGRQAFYNCVRMSSATLGSGLVSIGNYAFAECRGLKNLVFSNGAIVDLSLNEGVFSGCTWLTAVNLPANIKSVGDYAFRYCTSLKSVVLGNGLTSVGKYAFANCTALRSLNVGTSMGTFGDYAFSGCENLRYIYFHGLKPPTFGNYVFNKAPTAMIVYVADGGIGWGETNGVLPETWNSWTIKWGSEYTPDADAPYDLMFAETSELDSSFILCDSSEGRVAQHEFLKGNTIYARYAFRDAWADENITKPFTNHFSLGWNGGVQESLGVYVDEIPFYQIGSTALSSFRLRDLDVGSYRLLCILDSENIVAETDEDNNRQTYIFSVIPSTDVKFISEGNELANIKYATGKAYGKLFVPEKRIGFEFNGWYSDEYLTKQITETNTVPDSATTLYAQWDIRPLQTNYVSGTISSDSVWQAGDLYVIENNLTVAKNVKLTIEPGVIVKLKSGRSLTVNAGGTLSAVGTRVNPIVFTSFKDDTNGGDTNKDGDATEPAPGDWHQICNYGTVNMSFCKVLYCSAGNNQGALYPCGGEMTFDNSIIAHCQYDCMRAAGGGNFIARNSIFMDASMGVAPESGNSTFINCVFNSLTTAVRWGCGSFYNCIFSDIATDILDTKFYSSTVLCKFANCCFYNPEGTGDHASAKVGKNGNIWGDPKFVNPENGDFRIMGNSPCVDAGDGTIAPEKDYYGTPRMNVDGVRPTGVASVNGVVPDIGIYEVPGSGDIPSADLTVTQVTAPDEMTVGESVEIQWTVKNVGEETASGIWRDGIELVAANGQVLSMGTISTQADIKPGASANFRSTVTVPPAPEGAVQIRLTANKYQDVFECLKVENNAYSVLASLSVSTLNVPVDGNETVISIGSGSENGFAVNVPGGASAVLVIRGEGELKAWLGSGALSSSDTAIRTAVQVGDGLWLLQIPAGTDARVTLSNEGQEAVDIGLSMEVGDFFIFDTGLTAAIVNGASITLTGNGFDESMVCEIVQNGNVVATATDVIVSDSVQATAVFNLASLAAGDYTLRVTKGKDSASANLSLAYSKTGSKWTRRLEMASTIRSGRVYTGAFTYGNTGGAPMLAPYVILKAKSGTLIRLSESDAWTDTIEFLACSDTYPASVLKAGDTSKLTFFYKTTGNSANVSFNCTFDSTKAFPWDVNGQYMRPSWASDEMWNIAFSTLKTNVGATWNDFFDRMRANCDHLMKIGQPMKRLDRFWQIEINEALGVDHAIQTLAGGTDLARTGRGMGLSFSRIYGSSLSSRLMTGELGYGWKGNYSTYAELINSTTLAFHLPSGSTYQFTKVSGAWASEDARDKTQLSETTDAYILTYIDGTEQTVSKLNMRTSLIRDNQGNELSFTYNGNQLQKIQHSDGQSLTFTWSSGKVASVTDDQGRKVIYGYTGNLLTSVTAFNGLVTRYVYHTADSTPMSCALKQIVYPDGTTKDYTYDNIGRVATISVNGNKFTTEIVRGLCGSYSVIAPNGGVTEVTVGAKGETLKTVNALGQIVQQKYTADTQLESIIAPSGKRNKVNYNKDGQIMSTASASGAETSFAYEPNFDNLASVTDAKGHAISYGYDDKGRGNSISYVDGSMSSLEYNEKGEVVTATNRRGETIEYEYDAEGNLTKKLWQNGRTFTLAYDAKGNVTNAVDSVTGAVTMEYDANERLTRIVYPKNRGFTYKYDSVGRMTERASLDGIKQCYSYDSLGRLLKVTDGANAYLTNTYDPTTGWLITQTYGNGTVVSNAYDILGRKVGIYHLRSKGRIAFFEYAYDVDGKCISQTTAEGTESYTYDADGQLTAVTYPDGTSETFAYDAVGNRISRTGGSPVQNETYTVNNLNQYTEIVNAQAARSTMEYDLDGNMTRKGDTCYWYDTLNRLIAVTNEAENIRWSCEYDVFGNRVFVTDNGTTTERLFVQGSLPSVAAEYQGSTLIKSHVLVGAVRIADISRTGGSPVQTLYYHADILGSTRLLTDGTGVAKGSRSFKVFGETRISTGETTDAGYVGTLGVETDSNGLLFMRNRYYDAGIGRFVQMDPIGLNAGDVNVYRYCGNVCNRYIDPAGLWAKEVFVCAPLGAVSTVGKFGGATSKAANKVALLGVGAAGVGVITADPPLTFGGIVFAGGAGTVSLVGGAISGVGSLAEMAKSELCGTPMSSEDKKKAAVDAFGTVAGALTGPVASTLIGNITDAYDPYQEPNQYRMTPEQEAMSRAAQLEFANNGFWGMW